MEEVRERREGEGSGGGEKKQLVNDIVQLLFVDKRKSEGKMGENGGKK